MKKSFKPGTLLAPLPAVMVSCGPADAPNIVTVAWTGIANSEPPMAYISLRKSRFSHQLITESGEFVINLPTAALAKALDFCGVKSGRDVDKFKECSLTAAPAEKVGCPIIAECPLNLECKVRSVTELGSHDMFLADIVGMQVDDSLVDKAGRICLEKASLVAFSHGAYFPLPEKALGTFGFSVRKKQTSKKKVRK